MYAGSLLKTATTSSLGVLALLGLTGCGGSSSGTAAPPATSPSAAAQAQSGQRIPNVSGLLAAIQGTTLQVQDTSSQTAVVYTAKTTITQTVAASRADVAVGTCVSVRSAAAGGGAGSAEPPASPPTALTATSVTISAPVSGSCTGGFGGVGGRGGFAGRGGTPPTGQPRPSRSPRPGGFGGGFGGAFGKVTAVTGTTFTVASTGFGRPGASAQPSSAPVVVTTTATTTFDKQQKATASALKTGLCVTARGPEDSAGTLTATNLALRPAVNGTCTSGFGARNG